MKAPKKLWLQWYGIDLVGDETIDEIEEPIKIDDNITWSEHEIFNTDVEYIHKDVVVEILEDLHPKREEWDDRFDWGYEAGIEECIRKIKNPS